jgi:hypothetical protein
LNLSKLSRTDRSYGAERLSEYLEAVRHAPFAWGSHDCLGFVLGAVEAQTGKVYDIPAYSDPASAARVARGRNLLAELDTAFRRCAHVPPPGSIVAVEERGPLGYRLGIAVSDRAAFVSPSGLVFDRLQPETDLYWIVQ